MLYEKVYDKLLKEQGFENYRYHRKILEEVSKQFFEAGVKAAFNESVQTPALFKRKPK